MAQDQTKPPRSDPLMDGPWLSHQAAASLPDIRREFELNRDPMIRKQVLDLARTEAERRGEGSGRGSGMVERDKPDPHPRPPTETGHPVDQAAFSSRWLVEQRDAVLAAAAARQTPSTDAPRPGRTSREPSP